MSPDLPRLAAAAARVPQEERDRVLTEAVVAAARRMGLSGTELARILGVSAASTSRLARGRRVRASSREGEMALLLVRVFRSLDALVGGDETAARLWLRSENEHLGGVPAALMTRVEGLVRVAEYLDALRGAL